MKNCIKIGVVFGLFFLSSQSKAAPMIGQTPTTLTALDFLIKEHIIYVNYNYRFVNRGTDTTDEWVKFDGDSSFMKIFNVLEIDYGFEGDWTIRLIIPANFESKKFEPDTSYTSIKAGSIILDTKYNLFNPSKEMGFVGTFYLEFSPFLGIRLPTGDKAAFFSPTKSSTDLEFGLLGRIGDSKGALYLSVGYWSNGFVSKEEVPDELFYNATVEFPAIFNRLVFLCELDGLASTAEDKYYSLRIYPEVQYRIMHHLGAELHQKILQEFSIDAAMAFPLIERGNYKYEFAPYLGFHWRF